MFFFYSENTHVKSTGILFVCVYFIHQPGREFMHERTTVGVRGTALIQCILAEAIGIRQRSLEQLRAFDIYTCQL
jgi:hypothetical protein